MAETICGLVQWTSEPRHIADLARACLFSLAVLYTRHQTLLLVDRDVMQPTVDVEWPAGSG